jgi:hypothetical protein
MKYPTQTLSQLLPTPLLPCAPIHTPDFFYLNHSHYPLPRLFHSPFKIQMYNNMWFPSSLLADNPPLFQFCNIAGPDAIASTSLPFPLPTASIPAAAAVLLCTVSDPALPSGPVTGAFLHAAIPQSTNCLFLISYQPASMLRPCWYLVQVDLAQSILDPASLVACTTNGLGSILMTPPSLILLVTGGHSGTTSLAPPTTQSILVRESSSTQPPLPILLLTLPGQILFPSSTPMSTSLDPSPSQLPLLTLLTVPPLFGKSYPSLS